MGLLEISGTDLAARNVRCDRQHRSIAAMSVEKAIDKVKVAGTAATPAAASLPVS